MTQQERKDCLLRVWQLLFVEGACIELRAPKSGRFGTLSGYFDDREAFIKAALEWNNKTPGLYVTLNEIDPRLLARYCNRIQERAEHTTADKDVRRRLWLPVDFDVERPTGISSTEEEHATALVRAVECREWLQERYGVACVLADSGNGGHLLLPIDLPNDEASKQMCERFLKALSFVFDDPAVHVDTSMFNAGRIIKLYGTVAGKGDSTEERPHRNACLLDIPDALPPIPCSILTSVAARLPDEEKQGKPVQGTTGRTSEFDVRAYLEQHGHRIQREKSWQGGTCLQLEACPFNPDHTAPDSAVFLWASGKIGFRCFHNSCEGKDWADVREQCEPGYRAEKARREAERQSKQERRESVTTPRMKVTLPMVETVAWPAPLEPEAFHGIAGEIVRTIAPETEADPAAILFQILIAYGNLIGRNAYFFIAGMRHYTNLFGVIVGQSATAGKGTSWALAREILALAEAPESVEDSWSINCVKSGLSSGEGLIWAVRDPIEKKQTKKGVTELVLVDEGAEDKRLLPVETEFASVLDVINREKNTLSAVLRNAWDTGHLATLTKNSPAKARDAHISLIGHITNTELKRKLSETEQANGFGNRIVWIVAKRSNILPFGGRIPEEVKTRLACDLHPAIKYGSDAGYMDMNKEAKRLWAEVYPALTDERPGLLGSMTTRAAPVTLRFALLYALLDCSPEITPEHLAAALALWKYAEDSVAYIFGDTLGDPVADDILRELRKAFPNGKSRTEVYRLFSGHTKSERIGQALSLLEAHGLARSTMQDSDGGRPIENWLACMETKEGADETT